MRQRHNACQNPSIRARSIGVVLLLIASVSLAKPSAISPSLNPIQNAVYSNVASSGNIIHSIRFLPCSASSASSSPGSSDGTSDGDGIQLNNLALLYDAQSNMIMLKADGSSKIELDATSGTAYLYSLGHSMVFTSCY